MREEILFSIHRNLIFIRINKLCIRIFIHFSHTLIQCIRCQQVIMIHKCNVIPRCHIQCHICIV